MSIRTLSFVLFSAGAWTAWAADTQSAARPAGACWFE